MNRVWKSEPMKATISSKSPASWAAKLMRIGVPLEPISSGLVRATSSEPATVNSPGTETVMASSDPKDTTRVMVAVLLEVRGAWMPLPLPPKLSGVMRPICMSPCTPRLGSFSSMSPDINTRRCLESLSEVTTGPVADDAPVHVTSIVDVSPALRVTSAGSTLNSSALPPSKDIVSFESRLSLFSIVNVCVGVPGTNAIAVKGSV
mmetsp:Transcript_15638/g.37316  ORF Transcript_15638/g.37316 Transcript_15638/m.37316 type:complete len:205 (+) Transcript_15638:1678-2292(+)